MDLIVVESPVKAKTISLFLGKNYRVESTMGHIRDLPKKRLGVEIKQAGELETEQPTAYQFIPQYVLVVGKKKVVKQLKEAGIKANKIFLATDPDREGEAIAWHTTQLLLGKKKIPDGRIVFHEITQSAIKKALANPKKINMGLVEAQQARRVLDRLVGYKLSPLLWRKIRRGLSAGRVQSVAVRLIVEREREIEKFVPEEYWEILARLRRHLGGKLPDAKAFWAKLVKKNGKRVKVANETQTQEAVTELEKASYEAFRIEKKELKQNPPPPFTTSTLQQKAAQILRFSGKRTMRAAQSLYERGLITYHRTDSVTLAQEAIKGICQFIRKKYGSDFLPEKPRIYKTKSKVAQEAHEGVRPTDISKRASEMSFKTNDQKRVYDLIWKRALASQMAAAILDQTKIEVRAVGPENIYDLLAEGKVTKFVGWKKLYISSPEEKELDLPQLNQSDVLDLIKLKSEQKFTQPPPRYTEATLIKALEERGIGRPSTYAPIVSTIQTRQYVEKMEAKFMPTPLGTAVNDFLVEYFPTIVDYQFTAQMEDNLDEIANKKRQWGEVLSEFYGPFENKLKGVSQVAERVQIPTEITGENCPKCEEGKVVIRIGKFGKFLSCSRFPDCDYTAAYTPVVEGIRCPNCQGTVVMKKTRKGKRFYSCSKWPKCDWSSWRKPK